MQEHLYYIYNILKVVLALLGIALIYRYSPIISIIVLIIYIYLIYNYIKYTDKRFIESYKYLSVCQQNIIYKKYSDKMSKDDLDSIEKIHNEELKKEMS